MNSRIGIVQLSSQENLAENQNYARSMLKIAHHQRLDLVAFPETFLLISPDKKRKFSCAQSLDGEIMQTFQADARQYNLSILIGSFLEKIPEDSTKLYNTSVLINRDGEIQGVYRKIHLCDIDSFSVRNMESDDIKAGTAPIVVDHEIGMIGLTICYDLRFPGLYQHLRAKGAEIIFVPAAFFLHTGKDHWFPLLQARAIENQVYIVAPAQWGCHYGKRWSYGNSCVIDPWGTIITLAPERSGLFVGEIDMEYLSEIRRNMPVLQHRKYDIDM